MSNKDSFYNLETLGGILLFAAALIAIIIANSPYRLAYNYLFEIKGSIGIGSFFIKKPMLLWINDGLMAVYFLLIGLEIKREMRHGVLSHKKNLLVPIIAALSGLLIPALIFYGFNAHNPLYLQGWAILLHLKFWF